MHPDSKQLNKMRRQAMRVRAASACKPCRDRKSKCSDYRPCKPCKISDPRACIEMKDSMSRGNRDIAPTYPPASTTQHESSHNLLVSCGWLPLPCGSFRSYDTMNTSPGIVIHERRGDGHSDISEETIFEPHLQNLHNQKKINDFPGSRHLSPLMPTREISSPESGPDCHLHCVQRHFLKSDHAHKLTASVEMAPTRVLEANAESRDADAGQVEVLSERCKRHEYTDWQALCSQHIINTKSPPAPPQPCQCGASTPVSAEDPGPRTANRTRPPDAHPRRPAAPSSPGCESPLAGSPPADPRTRTDSDSRPEDRIRFPQGPARARLERPAAGEWAWEAEAGPGCADPFHDDWKHWPAAGPGGAAERGA